jgi:hypothetical protein
VATDDGPEVPPATAAAGQTSVGGGGLLRCVVPLRPLPGGPAGARGLRASDRTAGAVRQRNPVRGVPGANQLLRLHDTIQRLRLM